MLLIELVDYYPRIILCTSKFERTKIKCMYLSLMQRSILKIVGYQIHVEDCFLIVSKTSKLGILKWNKAGNADLK